MIVKKDSITSFIKIEDEFNKCLSLLLARYKLVTINKTIVDKQMLFDLNILEEQIFDKANKSVSLRN